MELKGILEVFKFAIKKNRDNFALPIILFILVLIVIVFLFRDAIIQNILVVVLLVICIFILLGFSIFLYFKLKMKEEENKTLIEREKLLKQVVRNKVFEQQINQYK